MSETLTFSEIQSRFDSEWVLVESPETGEDLQVKKGTVLCHSKDRDEVYRKARQLHPRHSAILYTGSLPDEMVVVL